MDRVESAKHRFKSLPFECQAIPRGLQSQSPKAMFKIQPKEVPEDFKEVVSTSSQPSYQSSVPLASTTPLEDMHIVRYCREKDCIDDAPKCWLCTLAVPLKMILMNPAFHDGKWFLAVRTYTGVCVLGLGVTSVTVGRKNYWRVDDIDDHIWMPILNPRDWSCLPVVWRSPIHLEIVSGSKVKDIALLQTTTYKKENLLMVSARHAFWTIPKTGLRQLSKFYGVHVPAGATFPELLLCLCEAVLGALSEEEKLKILRMRVPRVDEMKDFLLSEEASDLLTEEDKKELKEEADESEGKKHIQNISYWRPGHLRGRSVKKPRRKRMLQLHRGAKKEMTAQL